MHLGKQAVYLYHYSLLAIHLSDALPPMVVHTVDTVCATLMIRNQKVVKLRDASEMCINISS